MKDMIKHIADFLSGHIGLVSGLCAGLIVYFGNMRKTKGNEFKLYSLKISAGEIEEWHNVGLFAAYKLAEETGERYHKKIGSKNNPCKYQVCPVSINTYKGRDENGVVQFMGWNEDADGNMKDVWTAYFFTRAEYLEELQGAVTKKVKRDRWQHRRYIIGKSYLPKELESLM